MGVIYLQHPHHGIKVATTVEEAKADRELGWTDWSPEAFKAESVAGGTVAPAPAESDEVAALKAQLAAANERAEKAEAAVKNQDVKVTTSTPAATGVVPDFLKGNPKT